MISVESNFMNFADSIIQFRSNKNSQETALIRKLCLFADLFTFWQIFNPGTKSQEVPQLFQNLLKVLYIKIRKTLFIFWCLCVFWYYVENGFWRIIDKQTPSQFVNAFQNKMRQTSLTLGQLYVSIDASENVEAC